jgi:shikimate kinase
MNADHPPTLVLIGLRGSGKSTLGRLVAQRMGRKFIDLDDRTAARLGYPTVAAAWAAAGEPAFRAAETEALREALKELGVVIALGGGTPMAPGAAEMLRAVAARGEVTIVYLRCTPAELRTRLRAAGGAGANRPSLTGRDPLDEIEEVFARRDGVYRGLAETVIESVSSETDAITRIMSAVSA